LVDPNTRQGKRTPVTLKIKFKSETLEQFIERYAVDVSQGGIFIRTKEPLAVGTQMKFEFQLRDASPLIAGEGTVVWTRENDPSRPAIAPGMGVRFDRLADGSQGILERILTEKAKQAPQRPTADSAKPPLFTDTPTRVAPAPIQEALLGKENVQRRRDEVANDSHTPLPRPMPFHSDADEFPDEAFEEATKVRALDELIAQTADAAAEDAAARRANGHAAEELARPQAALPVAPDAPDAIEPLDLPRAPESGRLPRLLDTSPSPRIDGPAPLPTGADLAKKTVLGVEAPRGRLSTPPINQAGFGQAAFESSPALPPSMRSFPATEQTEPARRPATQPASKAPLLILLLLLVAAGGAAVWFLVIRPRQEADIPTIEAVESGTPGSAAVATPGSAGSATPAVGSAGPGSAVASATVPAELVETVIAANIEGATVEVTGTDQHGAAPLTAKLEKDKPYKVKVSAKGYVAQDLDLKGGDAKQTVKLVAKPRVIAVESDPAGALIFVDSGATGHTTPFEVELTAAQAAKKTIRVQLRKSGFRSVERVVELAKLSEDDGKLTIKVNEKLATAPAAPPQPRVPSGSNGGSAHVPAAGSDAGSSATGSDGSAATPGADGSGPVTTPGSAAGSGASAGSAEPEPGFTKPQP